MQHGGSKSAGDSVEMDEYFEDLTEPDDTEEAIAVPPVNTDETHREEVRRLTALVAHLRDQIGEMQSRSSIDASVNVSRSEFPWMTTVLSAAALVGAFVSIQSRNFR